MLDTFVRLLARDFHPATGRWVDVACTDCDGKGCDECAGQGHMYAWEPNGVHADERVHRAEDAHSDDAAHSQDAPSDQWQGWQIGG